MKRSMVFEGVTVTLLILLAFLMLAMVLGGSDQKEVSGIGEIRYTYTGDDDTLYVFSNDNTISAIGGDGTIRWSFEVPGQWSVCDYGYYYTNPNMPDGPPGIYMGDPIVSAAGGILYVFMKPARDGSSAHYMDGALMAISGGKELWELPFTCHNASSRSPYSNYQVGDARVHAGGGKVYVFHDYNETVISENGTVLWSVGNVSVPAAVDEQGFMYVVRSPAPQAGSLRYPYNVYVPDYREPSNIVDAYYPNGSFYWESRTENPLVQQYDRQMLKYVSDTLPLYHDGMIYAPMYDGITALYPNGTVKWTKTYGWQDLKFDWPFDVNNLTDEQLYDIKAFERMYANYNLLPAIEQPNGIKIRLGIYYPMPFDPDGNVYLQCTSDIPTYNFGSQQTRMFLITIGPDGNEVSRNSLYKGTYIAAKDGIGFATDRTIPREGDYALGALLIPSDMTDMGSNKLIVCDVESGKELWNYTFTANDPTVVTMDRNNVRALIGRYGAEEAINNSGVDPAKLPRSSIGPILSRMILQASPGDGVVYANFQSINYEYPVILGKSQFAYAGGIYAFDMNGTLLWQKPMLPFDSMQVTQNGTVFYRTPDGKIGVTNAGIAGGFTLTALLYLFLRFLCLGAVARAKARLNKNDNRNRVLDFIVRNPGSSMYEIARGTGMNLGTVRYHLFILSLNHKVVASQTDGKYVRYFTNSGTYSKGEQLILSLMRRDAMGRVLGLMLERPGISNVEIARELDIKESIVSRCVKELTEKGVIARDTGKGCSVDEAHREHVVAAMRRINGL